MYKNLEVLQKDKYAKIGYKTISAAEAGKYIGAIPVGFMEIVDMSVIAPIIILGEDENAEFVSVCGVSPEINIFTKQQLITPIYLKSYPFVNLKVLQKDEVQKLIGIDNNPENVGAKFENKIFDKKGELTDEAKMKIEMVKELNRQRDIGQAIIKEFKKHKLLVENNFKIKMGDKEKVIIEKFYAVDRKKLYTLKDEILLEWGKKGWLTLIDCHIKSLNNFAKVATV